MWAVVVLTEHQHSGPEPPLRPGLPASLFGAACLPTAGDKNLCVRSSFSFVSSPHRGLDCRSQKSNGHLANAFRGLKRRLIANPGRSRTCFCQVRNNSDVSTLYHTRYIDDVLSCLGFWTRAPAPAERRRQATPGQSLPWPPYRDSDGAE